MGLQEFNEKLDKLDQRLLDIVSERMDVMRNLAEYKKLNKIPLLDLKKDDSKLTLLQKKAKQEDLDKEFVKKLFEDVYAESKRVQREIY